MTDRSQEIPMNPRPVLALILFAVVVFGLSLSNVRGSLSTGPMQINLPDYVVSSAHASSCTPFDIKEMCCPSYCAADKTGSTNWTRKDEIFRGCLAGLGCSADAIKSANGFLSCGRGDDPKCGK